MSKTALYLISIVVFFNPFALLARHPFRQPNLTFPLITVAWEGDDTPGFSLRSPYVRLHPLFTFKKDDLIEYALPQEISYRTAPNKKMLSSHLSSLIEQALIEIKQRKKKIKRKKELEHFKVLQYKNFNFKKSCGLIVLKFKAYPLVVKLFLEQPSTFLNCRATGMEPTFFFYMGGGANRHLSGFTRLKNREAIIDKIHKQERWKDFVTFPRKWFWFPKEQKDMRLTGYNLAGHECIETIIPGIYAVIADEIDMTETTPIDRTTKSRMIMQLCNDLDMFIDPHEKNYVFSKDELAQRFTITIVDTEHFPTMVGILKQKSFKNHSRWYAYLAGKCFRDMYLQTKRDLLEAQGKVSALALM